MLSQALVLAACALGAVAQSTTTMASASAVNTATATLLVGSATTGLAASVIAADSCDTTYNLVCTDTAACSGIAATFTVTEGPTDYQFLYATQTGGGTGSVTESCSLSSSGGSLVHAVCSVGISLSAGGTSTSTSTTTTISGTGADFQYAQFPITAGGDKLASATGSCTASGNAAAATGVGQVYKVLVVPAAAAALAAGAML